MQGFPRRSTNIFQVRSKTLVIRIIAQQIILRKAIIQNRSSPAFPKLSFHYHYHYTIPIPTPIPTPIVPTPIQTPIAIAIATPIVPTPIEIATPIPKPIPM